MSNEIIVPPLNLPPPPRIDGPQPVCKCCFQSGHLYRDCNHPSLAQIHDLLVRVFVGAQTNPRQNTLDPDHCDVRASQNRLISQIPTYTMRALLWKSKHPSLLLTASSKRSTSISKYSFMENARKFSRPGSWYAH